MRKILAYCGMVFILALLAGVDVLILTSAEKFSRLVENELRNQVGKTLEWTRVRATLGGPVTVEGAEVVTAKKKLRPVQAERVVLRMRGIQQVERVELEGVRAVLSDDLFEELAGAEEGKSIRDVFPDPGDLPAIVCTKGRIETRLSAIFDGGRPQSVTFRDLSMTPIRGYQVHVEGTFESTLFGEWSLRGEVDLDTGARRLSIESVGLKLTPAVREPLADAFRHIYDKYLPGGLCDVRILLEQDAKGKPDVRVTLVARDMTLTYKNFPYAVEHMAGEIDFFARGFRVKHMRASSAGGATVRFDGAADGYDAESAFSFRIEIDEMPLDAVLRAAMEPETQRVYDLFSPSGKVSARGRAIKEAGADKKERIPLDLTFHNATLKYKEFPYEARNVNGEVSVAGSNVVVKKLTATDKDQTVEISGTIGNITGEAEVDLTIDARRLPLDARLKAAIGDEPRKIWDLFSPSGAVDLRWQLRKPRGGEILHTARARLRGNSGLYKEIPLPVTDLEGEIEMQGGRFSLNHLVGRCRGADVKIHGGVTDPQVSLHVDATGLVLDEEVKAAMPKAVGDFLRVLKLGGTVSFQSGLTFKKDGPRQVDLILRLAKGVIDTDPRFEDLDGTVTMTGYFEKEPMLMGFMSFTRATIFGKRITDVASSFNVVGPRLNFLNIKATGYAGLLGVRSFSLDTDTGEFLSELLTVDRMDLQEFAKDTKAYAGKTLAGKVTIEVRDLKGNSRKADTITGKGRLVIKDAVLWDVPVFLNLFVLNPGALFKEQKVFDAGAVEFDIKDRKFNIDRLAFTSETASVVGDGRVNFDGDLHLSLKPKGGPLLGVDFFLFRAGGELLSLLLGGALKVEVRGTFEKPEIR